MHEPFAGGGALALIRVDNGLLPVFVAQRVPRLLRRADVREAVDVFLRTCGPLVLERARLHCATTAPQSETDVSRECGSLALRDERLARDDHAASRLRQPGLFDRRAESPRAAGRHPRRRPPGCATAAVGPPERSRRPNPAPADAPDTPKAEASIALLLFITTESGSA